MFQGRLSGSKEGMPLAFDRGQIVAEDPAERGDRAVRAGEVLERGVRTSEEIEESQVTVGTLQPQVIDEAPGLGVRIALVSSSKAVVAEQGFQNRRGLDLPPVREA